MCSFCIDGVKALKLMAHLKIKVLALRQNYAVEVIIM